MKTTEYSCACVNLPTQIAYAQLLEADLGMKHRSAITRQIEENVLCAIKMLSDLPHLSQLPLVEPQGTFYIFPSIQPFIGSKTPGPDDASQITIENDVDFVSYMLEHRVVMLPGSAFGKPGHVRLALCRSLQQIQAGLEQFNYALSTLTQQQITSPCR